MRGNGQIIQELEAIFRGAGWNVIKVLWGSEWDDLLEKDTEGLLVRRMGEVVDGEYQKYAVEIGRLRPQALLGRRPAAARDGQAPLGRTAEEADARRARSRTRSTTPTSAPSRPKGAPTVILARTIKGYGVGESGEGKNVTHQQKKLNDEEVKAFRTRFGIPISDEEVAKAPFYRPPQDSVEINYVKERRDALGGAVPKRQVRAEPIRPNLADTFAEFHKGTEARKASTTMVFVRMLSKLLRDEQIGKLVVPIVPDEARTFGMEALFRQVGIYAHSGQLYEPVDMDTLLYYKEAEDGQILEEGINEAGSMSSFIAAGTAYATHGINTIPFFIFYSMFGFQRVGDLIWAGADMRMRGFVLGGTAGRTTLNGEGLQHQDGHSHVLASPVPTCQAYDPAFAYELAVIIEDGIKRMYGDQENIFYYLTLMNEQYEHPPMPEGARDGILKGMYVVRPTSKPTAKLRAQLFGSGTILMQALEAQQILEERYGVGADVWSVTSYVNLYRDGHACERWNRLHPADKPRVPYRDAGDRQRPGCLRRGQRLPQVLPDSIDRWLPRRLQSLGTDGFGRSETRAALRDFFEVDARFITLATLHALLQEKQMDRELRIAVHVADGVEVDQRPDARDEQAHRDARADRRATPCRLQRTDRQPLEHVHDVWRSWASAPRHVDERDQGDDERPPSIAVAN